MKLILLLCIGMISSVVGQDVVQVVCSQTSITARIQKDIVENAGYSIDDVHLNDKDCVFDTNEGGFFSKQISPLTSCGTNYLANETHVEFSNSISTVETGLGFPYGVVVGSSSNSMIISAAVSCTYRIDLTVSTMFIPNITIVTINVPDAVGRGWFQAAMALYTDDTYLTRYQNPPLMDADATLHVGVYIIGEVSQDIYLLVEDCWGTIRNDSNATPKYPLIQDGCAVKAAADGQVRVAQNGIGHQVLWNSPVFKFVGAGEEYDNVWLHCDLQLCINAPCEPTCAAKRRKRRSFGNGEVIGRNGFNTRHVVTLGPISRLNIAVVEEKENLTNLVDFEVDFKPKPPAVDVKNSSVWNLTATLIISALSVVVLICLLIVVLVVRKTRSPKSREVNLGEIDGVVNRSFSI